MPSLEALGKFKASFNNIANEKDDVMANNLPFDDLPLPETDASPMELSLRDSYSTGGSDSSQADTGGFDINDFLNSLPVNAATPADEPPSIDDLFQGDTNFDSFLDNILPQQDGSSAESTEIPEDDIFQESGSPPEELLSDMSGEPVSPDFGFDDLGADISGAENFASGDSEADASGLEDFGFDDLGTDTSTAVDSGLEDIGDLGENALEVEGFTSGDSSADVSGLEDFGFDDLGTDTSTAEDFASGTPGISEEKDFEIPDAIDLGGESPHNGDFEDDGFNMPVHEDPFPDIISDFESPDTGSGFESSFSDEDFAGIDESAQDDFTASTGFDTDEVELSSEESFDNDVLASNDTADFGSDFASDSIDLDEGNELEMDTLSDLSDGDLGGDDFALPGLEEIFDKTKVEVTAPAPKRGFFRRKKVDVPEEPEPEDIEEIQLSQGDLDKLLKTLAAYPLNLRIACEEMIAEQVLLPQQLSKLIRLLVNGAHVRETAALAEEILGKPIIIPKSYEKMTGAEFEAEQTSFSYIFVHNFLPVFRLFAVIAALGASVFYLSYRFIYIPAMAESLYKRGYERISAGEYQRANQLFNEAFAAHRKKKWFYLYAESFRDQRRYLLAEEKYDELLRYYPRDKQGVLDYARLQTYYLLNYDKANRLLQQQLLDYAPNDFEGLIAAGDNFLAWADSDPSRFYDRYEDARFSYARLLERYGWQVPIVERMMRYFIRTDNLKEVLNLRVWFENDTRRRLSPSSLAELGGYLLDKQLEETRGVPDPFIESIESVRAMLLQAVREDPVLPEPHYHLARYHHSLGNIYEERLTLENAIRAFDLAETESISRRLYRVDTHYRYSNLLVNNREFFPAEEQVIKGIQLYEDFLSRNLIRATPQLGQLYAAKGDLEYFVKSGNMRAALNDYRLAERYGFAPPEMQYRMGAAYYQLEDWQNAQDYLFKASAELPLNRRLLYALGNVTYQRGNYFAAQGYYSRLLDILEYQRVRLPVLLPNDNPNFLELGERLMMARNNAGVVYEALAEQTGNREYRSRALALYAESARAWDSITRNPETMVRMRLTDSPGTPSINLGYLNANNAMRPSGNYSPQIFPRIDKDVLEPSRWEELAPFGGLQ